MMSQDLMHQRLAALCAQLAGRALDGALQDWLNATHGPGTPLYDGLAESMRTGVAEGWLCQREGGGIRYGRVFKPEAALAGCSVDVVEMPDLAGPHHVHPNGEIDLIVPLDAGATFDGHPAGWCVYPSGSAHCPTVRGGRAQVLYLLPGGAIQFTGA